MSKNNECFHTYKDVSNLLLETGGQLNDLLTFIADKHHEIEKCGVNNTLQNAGDVHTIVVAHLTQKLIKDHSSELERLSTISIPELNEELKKYNVNLEIHQAL